MAAATFGEQQPLKCQTWVLKVSIHCQGCKRKVKKVLQGIDGVYAATVDSQQQSVTVTGNIEVETLIRKLMKTGKRAEIWPQKLASKEEESPKAKAIQNQDNSNKNQDYSSNNGKKKSVKFSEEGTSEDSKNVITSLENPPAGKELPEVKNKDSESEDSDTKSGCKKKKKKGQIGENSNTTGSSSGLPCSGAAAGTGYQSQGADLDQVVGPSNLNPTRQQWVPFPQGFNTAPVYASSYSMAYPRESPGPFYYVPPSPYPHTNRYQMNSQDSFYYFSDENVYGCSIM